MHINDVNEQKKQAPINPGQKAEELLRTVNTKISKITQLADFTHILNMIEAAISLSKISKPAQHSSFAAAAENPATKAIIAKINAYIEVRRKHLAILRTQRRTDMRDEVGQPFLEQAREVILKSPYYIQAKVRATNPELNRIDTNAGISDSIMEGLRKHK